MHGDRALTAPGADGRPRLGRARFKTVVVGTALMGLLLVPIELIGALRAGNVYPVGATLVGALTGWLFGRAARTQPGFAQLRGAAWCAALVSALGTLGAVLLGHLPAQNIFIAAVTGAVAGGVGAVVNMMRRPRRGV